MKNDRGAWLVIIIIVAMLLINYSQNFIIQNNQWYSTELGWQGYSFFDNQFENAFTSTGYFESKYWNVTGAFNQAGGDANITTTSCSGTRESGCNGGNIVYFKDNLKNKYFRINYYIEPITFSGDPISDTNDNKCLIFNEILRNGQGTIEIQPNIINESLSKLYINGAFKKNLDSSKGLYLDAKCNAGFSTSTYGGQYYHMVTMTLLNPRYKPLFECSIDNDEVLAFDEFSTSFNINNLNYKIEKFCINNPPQIRSFTQSGIATDYNGQLLIYLSQGKTINVQNDQTIRIYYITKNQNGTIRCNLNEAYNTFIHSCENILSPPNNQTEPRVILEPIIVGKDEILYLQKYNSNPLYIGKTLIPISAPTYNCSCDYGFTIYPNPEKSCWKTNINGTIILSEQSYKFTDYVKLDYTFSGMIYKNASINCDFRNQQDWTNIIKIKIDKEGFKMVNGSNKENIKLNGNTNFKVVIMNELGYFTNSGIDVKITKNIIGLIQMKEYIIPLNKGTFEYNLPLDTSMLGENTMEIIPYIFIMDKKIYGSTKLILNYNILNNQTNVVTREVDNTDILNEDLYHWEVINGTNYSVKEVEVKVPYEVKVPATFFEKYGIALIILIISGGIIFWLWKRK